MFSAVSSYVYLGAHNLYDTEAGRKIIYTTTFLAHPDYDQDSIANDVSLVKLPAGSLTEYTGGKPGKWSFKRSFVKISQSRRRPLLLSRCLIWTPTPQA